jgi:hypothetical protein
MKDEIKIEKNIPIPTRKRKYPFEKMEVGDSFTVPLMKHNGSGLMTEARRFALKKRLNWDFMTKTVVEGRKHKVKKTRIWRIK